MPQNTQRIRGKSGLETLRPAPGSLPPWARNSNTWPSLTFWGRWLRGRGSEPEASRGEEEEHSQKTGSLGALAACSSTVGRGAGRWEAAARSRLTPAGRPRTARYPDGGKARADGRCRARAVAVAAARSTSRPPARGRPALPAPPPLPRGARAGAGSERSQLPLQSPPFPSARLARHRLR